MNLLRRYWRDLLALLIAGASLYGLWVMFNAEWGVWLVKFVSNPDKPKELLSQELLQPSAILSQYNSVILPSLKNYSMAIGLILLAVSVAYILLGAQDEISTLPDEPNPKK